ncbi:uroporphyrinogen-III C-methyltransferase [Thermodesulfobacterium hveragerdense]|uniref:uroporphyrinogen-III C-methyltransferase n=1 Tax=Thermodesulfobacterium hveragerdense TaxID=53424 RepID=UPI00040E6DA0|nr:uroporphyrinogen-III C-methyltransferase [Thermodesulfobacterium hveragerdense]
MTQGKVYLVGAGPGDPHLFTLKGKRILEQAEVVVYDYLANPKLLSFCKEEAEKIYVGKKGGEHTLPQEEINKLLVKKAKEGKKVVRLKGGDPFLFGRGGEELEELVKEGIPFEVVPGITSAIAVPAYAGIPVTHRDYTSTLAIITGHEAEGKPESKIDFKALAKLGTLVFLMGVKNLKYIVENLIKEGKDPKTPVALIQWGTLPKQKVVTGCLENIVAEVERVGLKPPAIIVVGEVVKLRPQFNWFERKPLFGKRIAVTRTREQASKLSSLLEELGAEVVELPLIKVVPVYNTEFLERLTLYDWLVFTSENGVRFFIKALLETERDLRALKDLKIAVIGKATAEALEGWGIKADLIPEKNFTQEGLLEAFSKIPMKGKKVLIARAKEARDVLPKGLEELGAIVDIVSIYQTVLPEETKNAFKEELKQGVDVITFTSSSTVKNFFRLLLELEQEGDLKNTLFASIGPITSQELIKHGVTPQIEAKEYTIPGLVEAILTYFTDKTV